jgi:hypothetical protein
MVAGVSKLFKNIYLLAQYHMGKRKEKSIETALNLKELKLVPFYLQN